MDVREKGVWWGESNGEDKAVQKLPLLYSDQLCNQNSTGGFFTCDRPSLFSSLASALLITIAPACLTKGPAVCARGVEILGRARHGLYLPFGWISSRDCPLSARARPSPIRVRERGSHRCLPAWKPPGGSRSASPFSWAPPLVCAAQAVRKPNWTALDTKRAR